MSLKVRIMGSGTVIPEAGRACTSICVESERTTFLFDCGPGVPENLAGAGLTPADLDHIVLSHFHPDHTLGLPRLLSALKNGWGPEGAIDLSIIGPAGTSRFIEGIERSWPGLSGGIGIFVKEMKNGEMFDAGRVRLTAIKADHGSDPALSFRVDHDRQSIVYSGDCGFTDGLADAARGSDLLICECSSSDDDPRPGHMTPSDIVRLVKESGPSKLVLVHIYPAFDRGEIVGEIGSRVDIPVEAATDGDVHDIVPVTPGETNQGNFSS